jgi:small subunit ribosomal protein S17
MSDVTNNEDVVEETVAVEAVEEAVVEAVVEAAVEEAVVEAVVEEVVAEAVAEEAAAEAVAEEAAVEVVEEAAAPAVVEEAPAAAPAPVEKKPATYLIKTYPVVEAAEVAVVEDDGTRDNSRKVREGIVVSDKMDRTLVVAVNERVAHPKYGKTVQRTKKLYVHDENNDAKKGDRVRVQETRPLSKLKRWRLTEVVERAR